MPLDPRSPLRLPPPGPPRRPSSSIPPSPNCTAFLLFSIERVQPTPNALYVPKNRWKAPLLPPLRNTQSFPSSQYRSSLRGPPQSGRFSSPRYPHSGRSPSLDPVFPFACPPLFHPFARSVNAPPIPLGDFFYNVNGLIAGDNSVFAVS